MKRDQGTSECIRFTAGSPEETEALGARIGPVARRGDVLALSGPLGAGKTTFARGVIRALSSERDEAPSPTFTLVQVYEPRTPATGLLWHFDLYRLDAPEDAYELGIEEAFTSGISLIEWPERLGPLLPADRLDVDLSLTIASEETRTVVLHGPGDWLRRLREAGLA